MRAFATLLDRLLLTPARNGKLALLEGYLRAAPDPDRGWALAALTGTLDLRSVKPALLRAMVGGRMDAELFALSYDYVGDLAETVALVWETGLPVEDIPLSEAIARLEAVPAARAAPVLAGMLDRLDPPGRFALLKLATGGLRVGVSARLAKQALARMGGVEVAEIEEIWHGLTPPYPALFAWLEGQGPRPDPDPAGAFRPMMLATALDAQAREAWDPADYLAEWKWDGIRVQLVSEGGQRRIYSRTGDEISAAFPDIAAHLGFDAVLDGELLVARTAEEGPTTPGPVIASFGDLQQRLNRKTVTKALLASHPAFVRVYDLLSEAGEDLRALPFETRRARLEAFLPQLPSARFDLSPLVAFDGWEDLDAKRAAPEDPAVEGVMLKRRDSAYVPGRPRGPWFKWKRDPFVIDAVLLYAQRGHGKRSGYYSDYTFGVWDAEGALVPVGKAYFGFTDAELRRIDRYVRDHTIDRFGPVRSVRASAEEGLVFEVAFEGLNRSTRHKSGLAMRFPRISRLRWDKPPGEADTLASLEAMLEE